MSKPELLFGGWWWWGMGMVVAWCRSWQFMGFLVLGARHRRLSFKVRGEMVPGTKWYLAPFSKNLMIKTIKSAIFLQKTAAITTFNIKQLVQK
jgi:hypothetical protein